ncbi:hypothetical protein MNBD_GAMMA12-598, partial [hydrothermal vent metagenome]
MPNITQEYMVQKYLQEDSGFIERTLDNSAFWYGHVSFFIFMSIISLFLLKLTVNPAYAFQRRSDNVSQNELRDARFKFFIMFILLNTFNQMFLINEFGMVLYVKANWVWHVLDFVNTWTSLRFLF